MHRHATPIRRGTTRLLSQFPRRHIVLASATLTVIATLTLLLPSDDAQAKRHSIPLDLQFEAAGPGSDPEAFDIQDDPLQAVAESAWQQFEVGKGDNLSLLFQRAGLGAADVYSWVNSAPEAKDLSRIYPGQSLAFQFDEDGQLTALKHQLNRLQATVYRRDGDSFSIEQEVLEPEVRTRFVTGTIRSSLYMAGQEAGLPDALLMEMANIFSGVMDFVFDVRADDQFLVLFEERFLDGEKIGNGAILAAQFINRGTSHNAFRYETAAGDTGYYNQDGVSMRRAFLRAPLDFSRISSGFNPTRLHPIHKTVRPHRGIDYAAPTGTPVYAAGDGRVIESGYSKANGNYVVVQHGTEYITKYLHLNKRSVRKGDRVKQRQLVGTVGSTGYATGPHLHYEFLVNGVHRNPRTILDKLPKTVSIAKAEQGRFMEQISGLQLQLATYQRHSQYAASQPIPGNES